MPPNNLWASDDVIGDRAAAREYPRLEVTPGLELTHRPSRVTGVVVRFTQNQRIVLSDQDGNLHDFKPHPGVLLHRGNPVELVVAERLLSSTTRITASGSIGVRIDESKVAQASRIWVEGTHDAELIEKIWGDDLRVEGIVVEPLHGVNDLCDRIAAFHPAPRRRLGVLLDHLVPGSKESKIAAEAADPDVLIRGHPYVDVWQAIRPGAMGIDAWPHVPRTRPWKEGVVAALGRSDDPGAFWQQILASVSDYRDVETALVNAVEQLIDFVTA